MDIQMKHYLPYLIFNDGSKYVLASQSSISLLGVSFRNKQITTQKKYIYLQTKINYSNHRL